MKRLNEGCARLLDMEETSLFVNCIQFLPLPPSTSKLFTLSIPKCISMAWMNAMLGVIQA